MKNEERIIKNKKLIVNNYQTKTKRFLKVMLCVVMLVSLVGCGKNEPADKENMTTTRTEKTVAIRAGESTVYLDEARYYAYNTQGTYEIFHITEGKEIDWNGEMKKGVTWQQGVKSIVLDDICRRECMYALAESYNVSLSDEEKEEIDIEVKNYFSKTNAKLISKVNISEERLKYVFEKDRIADKVEDIMTASNKNLPDETYEKWKSGNTVMTEEQWNSITFNETVFTLEDIQ